MAGLHLNSEREQRSDFVLARLRRAIKMLRRSCSTTWALRAPGLLANRLRHSRSLWRALVEAGTANSRATSFSASLAFSSSMKFAVIARHHKRHAVTFVAESESVVGITFLLASDCECRREKKSFAIGEIWLRPIYLLFDNHLNHSFGRFGRALSVFCLRSIKPQTTKSEFFCQICLVICISFSDSSHVLSFNLTRCV